MGNHIICASKMDLKSAKPGVITRDDFIIKYAQKNETKHFDVDINTLDQRRMIFVSLLGAYQTWKKCPPIHLYSALFLIPLKKDWIYHPMQYSEELYDSFVSIIYSVSDSEGRDEFIELLKWKDSQNLVFWMLDEYENVENNTFLADPFWYYLSNKISDLYDPITSTKYQPLNLDDKYWQNEEEFSSKYCIKTCSILSELFFVTMKYKAIQEIIYDSNPKSLMPIRYYGDKNISETTISDVLNEKWFDEDSSNNWWISSEYNPDVL